MKSPPRDVCAHCMSMCALFIFYFFVWHVKAVMLCANYHERLVVLSLALLKKAVFLALGLKKKYMYTPGILK